MKKHFAWIAPLSVLASFLAAPLASAQCPVCAIGAAAGVGLARWLGIDDTISGLWVGGMMVALVAWTINWFNRKNIHFKGRIILTTLVYYVVFLYVPLYLWTDLLNNPLNTMFGYNKFFIGTIVGSIVFFAMNVWYQRIKRKNAGHAWFPFQKVVWPVGSLLLLSLILFPLMKYIPF